MNRELFHPRDVQMQDWTLGSASEDDQQWRNQCSVCRQHIKGYIDTYIDVFVNSAAVDELKRNNYSCSFHHYPDNRLKYLARFDWNKVPVNERSLTELQFAPSLNQTDIYKVLVDNLVDISNHHKVEYAIHQLYMSRRIRLFGIKVDPLSFVLEQPNIARGEKLKSDTLQDIDHVMRIVAKLLPEKVMAPSEFWTAYQHPEDESCKWRFNSSWKFIIRLQEDEGAVTTKVIKTAVREALEEFTLSVFQQQTSESPLGSVLENLKSLFVSKTLQDQTSHQTANPEVTSSTRSNSAPSVKATTKPKRVPISSRVPVDKSTLKRARTLFSEGKLQTSFDHQNVQTTSLQGEEDFWLKFVRLAFPDYHNRCYFIPPVYMNRVLVTMEPVAGLSVLVPREALGQAGQAQVASTLPPEKVCAVLDSDVRDDRAQQHVFLCLRRMAECSEEKGMMVLSQLQFGDYLNEPAYAAAVARFQLPVPSTLSSDFSKNWKRGDFDVLIIHRLYGLVVVEVKAFGDNVSRLNMSPQDVRMTMQKKLKQAVSILDKCETMLSHLVSDIAPRLRVTKSPAFPNIRRLQVLEVVAEDPQLRKDLCTCLRVSDPVGACGKILCLDDLSDPSTPWKITSDTLKRLETWWQQLVAEQGTDPAMTSRCYECLLARFCGPATTVSVPGFMTPRLSIRTMGEAVSAAGEAFTCMALFPEQVGLLNESPPRVFLAGPPGTGKTVLLLLEGMEYLRRGHKVHIVSTWPCSHSANVMLYHLLQQHVSSPCQTEFHCLDLESEASVEEAAAYMARKAENSSLHILADEAGPDTSENFQRFCLELMYNVPHLHLWAASCFHRNAPAGWQVNFFTRPLRSPPVVVREVELAEEIGKEVACYTDRGVSAYTDGPSVKVLYHRSGEHHADYPQDCFQCGREIAAFLRSLHVDASDAGIADVHSSCASPPTLQFRDILVLCTNPRNSDVISGLVQSGIPIQVFREEDVEDMATACSNVVWLADPDRVRGLERKIVVWLQDVVPDSVVHRLHTVSRCTSQLVLVLPQPAEVLEPVTSHALELLQPFELSQPFGEMQPLEESI